MSGEERGDVEAKSVVRVYVGSIRIAFDLSALESRSERRLSSDPRETAFSSPGVRRRENDAEMHGERQRLRERPM